MAIGPQAISQSIGFFGGAVQDLFDAKGLEMQAQGYRFQALGYRRQAAGMREAASYTKRTRGYQEQSIELQLLQANRNIDKTLGGQRADVAAAGFSMSGSALDLMRDSAAQAKLTTDMIDLQGEIDLNTLDQQYAAYLTQADVSEFSAYTADTAAKSAEDAADAKRVGSVFKMAAGGLGLLPLGIL